MIPLLIGACPTQEVVPSRTMLSGQVTLSSDLDRGVARLRVVLHEPVHSPLPSERQGLALDRCETLVPVSAVATGPPTEAEVRAWCEGEEVPLRRANEITWVHKFRELPEAGFRCRVEITEDGVAEDVELPPLPAPPDLEIGRGLTWTAQGADEIRLSVPRSEGRTTLCRLADDGSAPAPRGLRLQQGFTTRVELEVIRVGQGELELASLAGVWLPAD